MKMRRTICVMVSLCLICSLLGACHQADDVSRSKPLCREEFENMYNIVTTAEDNKVILDTDMQFLSDDAYTLFELLSADEMGYIELLGVTAAGGNCLVSSATYDILTQLEYAGRQDIRVCMGTDEPLNGFLDIEQLQQTIGRMDYTAAYAYLNRYTTDYTKAFESGLTYTILPPPSVVPDECDAVDFMIEQVHKYPGKVTIMAIAGLTNIAKAIEKDPGFAADAAGIVYMGGVFDVPGDELPSVEINWWYDPEAANICLNAAWKSQLVIPHDAAVTCTKGEDVYLRYKSKNVTRITRLIVDNLAPIYENGGTEELLYCWDPITAAVMLCPDLIIREETRQLAVDSRMGMTYGSSFAWREGSAPEGMPSCEVVFQVDRERFWDFVSDLYIVSPE